MVIGERIKMARRGAQMSLRALAKEVGVSAQAISKYERGLDIPSSPVLLRLSRALNVKSEYFFRPTEVSVSITSYRRLASLGRKKEQAISVRIQEWLERYMEVERLFPSEFHGSFSWPAGLNRHISSSEEVERVAKDLRRSWELGLDPIENIVQLLEDKGIKIGLIDGYEGFDACTFWANEEIPVIAVNRRLQGDRQRFNVAHELGHLVLEPAENVNVEYAARRFAGAFLVPEEMVRFELGEARSSCDLHELHLLKHKYGLSMQGWIYRAKDLNILSEPAAIRLFRIFRRRGWYEQEPGDQIPIEEPDRMKRLVLRALTEDLISKSRASELLGEPLLQFLKKEEEKHALFPVDLRN